MSRSPLLTTLKILPQRLGVTEHPLCRFYDVCFYLSHFASGPKGRTTGYVFTSTLSGYPIHINMVEGNI